MKKVCAESLAVGDVVFRPTRMRKGEYFAPFLVIEIEDCGGDPLVWLVPDYNELTEENFKDGKLLYLCERPEDLAQFYELVAKNQPIPSEIQEAMKSGKVEMVY